MQSATSGWRASGRRVVWPTSDESYARENEYAARIKDDGGPLGGVKKRHEARKHKLAKVHDTHDLAVHVFESLVERSVTDHRRPEN